MINLKKSLFGILPILLTVTSHAFSINRVETQLTKFSGLLVGPHARPLTQPVLRPFTSDGCSLSPNGIPMGNSEWVDCCVNHDIKYWVGGTSEDRQNADLELKQCMEEKGFPKIAEIYYLSVRAGGTPHSKTSFRWGYGWNQVRPYSPLTPEEIQEAEFLYGHRLEILKKLVSSHQVNIELKLNVYSPSQTTFSEAELEIYNHLRKSLTMDQVIAKVISVEISNSSKVYQVYLSRCMTRPLTYRFEGNQSLKLISSPQEGCGLK